MTSDFQEPGLESNPDRVCHWQHVYLFDNFLRPLVHKPETLFAPYVSPGMTVMDVGCGRGFASLGLAKLVGEQGRVVSVDLQTEMLAMVKKRSRKAGLESRIRTHQCTETSIDVKQQMDFVLAFWMAHEVPSQERFLHEVFTALKPGGRFFLAEPRGHVSLRDFEDTVALATRTGFQVADTPRVRFSRAVLLSKPARAN